MKRPRGCGKASCSDWHGCQFEDPGAQCSVLHQAIVGGHEQLAKELMIGEADAEARNSLGSTPLHLAAGEGLNGVVSAILLRGVHNTAINDDGDSALIYASVAYDTAHLAVVETLLAAGADVNHRGALATRRSTGLLIVGAFLLYKLFLFGMGQT